MRLSLVSQMLIATTLGPCSSCGSYPSRFQFFDGVVVSSNGRISALWIVFPSYGVYALGSEIQASLESATPRQRVGRPKSS